MRHTFINNTIQLHWLTKWMPNPLQPFIWLLFVRVQYSNRAMPDQPTTYAFRVVCHRQRLSLNAIFRHAKHEHRRRSINRQLFELVATRRQPTGGLNRIMHVSIIALFVCPMQTRLGPVLYAKHRFDRRICLPRGHQWGQRRLVWPPENWRVSLLNWPGMCGGNVKGG